MYPLVLGFYLEIRSHHAKEGRKREAEKQRQRGIEAGTEKIRLDSKAELLSRIHLRKEMIM